MAMSEKNDCCSQYRLKAKAQRAFVHWPPDSNTVRVNMASVGDAPVQCYVRGGGGYGAVKAALASVSVVVSVSEIS